MKRYRHPRRPRAGGPRPADLFRAPAPDFYRLPDLTIRGGRVATDGCRRVLDFTPEKICLDLGRTLVTLYGEELRIESLAGYRLVAAGQIAKIEFSRKWKGGENGV